MKTSARIEDIADRYDLVAIGAGPAGLSAASAAAGLGLSVLLVDENISPGGQIYRAVTTTPVRRRDVLGEDFWRGAAIVERFNSAAAHYAPRAIVWSVSPDAERGENKAHEIAISSSGRTRTTMAGHVIVATGALERPFPIAGWTLPGVMTAGAAQIALKSSGIIPDGRVILAGCGPLLYLLAAQLASAGADIVALLDTTPRRNWRAAAKMLPDFMRSALFLKGLGLLARTRFGLRRIAGVTGLRAEGENSVRGVIVARGDKCERIDCDALLLHQGVIPNINMASAIGCALEWDESQRCFAPRVDPWFFSSADGVSIAGDGVGIGGAGSAALRGEIAALGAAHRLGRLSRDERDRRGATLNARLAISLRGRAFLDTLYLPAPGFLAPRDDAVIVCRCEEVTAGQIRKAAAELGVAGPNQMKAFLRCGMGPCQGRLCGPTVTEIIAETRGASPANVGYYRLRPPVKPVTLAEIASLPQTDEAVRAVVR